MRKPNPKAHQDIWMTRFLRVVLVRQPALRWKLDYTRIDTLYQACPDPVTAAQTYLKS